MATNYRNLLSRLSSLMLVNVTLADDLLIEDDDLVRLVGTRNIREVLEVVRILYTALSGHTLGINSSLTAPPNLAGVIGLCARSCWTRHILAAAQRDSEQRQSGGLCKAYASLVSILRDIQRTTHTNTTYKTIQRIRHLPIAYRNFYSMIDAMAP
jgi:hypothetical protein